MGLAIYINKKSLADKGIEMIHHNEDRMVFCECGCCEGGWCDCCGGETYTTTHTNVEVEGLPRMHDYFSKIWQHANHWGDNNEPLRKFIELHGLIKEEDWYEA